MELFGYTRETFAEHIDSFSARACIPTTASRVEAAIARAVERCGDYEADYRVVHPDGTVRWVAARGRVLCDPEGRPVRMLGAAYDTTAVHSAAERLGRVLETMSTAFITLDREWRFTYVNAAAERIFDRRRDELVGRSACGTVHPELESGARHGPGRELSSSSTRRWTLWFDVRATPEPGRRERLLPRHHRSGPGRARARGRRPGGCRSSPPPAPAWRARSRSTSCSRILADVVLNGFGEGVAIALGDRIVHTGGRRRRRPAVSDAAADLARARAREPGRARPPSPASTTAAC